MVYQKSADEADRCMALDKDASQVRAPGLEEGSVPRSLTAGILAYYSA
jgi:hypothetical protein